MHAAVTSVATISSMTISVPFAPSTAARSVVVCELEDTVNVPPGTSLPAGSVESNTIPARIRIGITTTAVSPISVRALRR